MNALLLAISVLVGILIGFLSLGLIDFFTAFQSRERERTKLAPSTVVEQISPLLQLIEVPKRIQWRWGTNTVRRNLEHSGLPWTLEDFVAVRWLSLWGGLLTGVVFGFWRGWDLFGQFLAALSWIAGFVLPRIWLIWQVDRRQQEIDLALPNLLDRLALGMEAGLGFEISLRRTAQNYAGLLGEEVRRLVRQLDRGHPRGGSLDEMVLRNPSPDLRAFVAAVKQSERLGTSLARTLRIQTDLLRASRRRRAEEASRRLPVLIVFPLVFFFLPALLIIYLAPPILHLFLGR